MRFSSSKGALRPRCAAGSAAGALTAAILVALPTAFPTARSYGQVWDGGGTDNNFSSASNWNPDAVPANTGAADLTFAGSLRTSPDLDLDFAANSLHFASTSPFTLISSGSHVLTLGGGGIASDASPTTMRILTPLALGSSTATPINVAQGAAPLGWDLEIFGPTGESAGVTGSIIKSGPGILSFTSAVPNSYSGVTTVNEGTLVLASTALDGAIHGDLVIGDGVGGTSADVVVLAASNQIDQSPGRTVTINSSGLLSQGYNNETLYNVVDNGRIEMQSANLQVNGTAAINGVLESQQNSNFRFLGAVTGNGGTISSNPNSTWYFASTYTPTNSTLSIGYYSDATFAGKVTMTNGIIDIDDYARAHFQSGLAVSTGIFGTGNNAVVDCSGGLTVNMCQMSLDIASTFELVSGDLVSTANFGDAYIVGVGALVLDQSPTIINTPNGIAQNDLEIAAPMVGAGAGVGANIVKQGAGELLLAYTAGNGIVTPNNINSIQVRAGTLQIGTADCMLGAKVTFSGGVLSPIIAGVNLNNDITVTGPTTFDAPTALNLTLSGTISGTGSVTKIGGGKLVLATSIPSLSGFTITDGTVEFPSSAQTHVMHAGNLSLGGTAKLNLQTNALITATPVGSWNGTTYTGVTGYLRAGRGGNTAPYWDGPAGILTSQSNATAGNYTTIGIAKGAEVIGTSATATALWQGQTISGSDTLVMYTYGGDTNLDGKVNIDDYIRIDYGISAGLSGWANGDFNYDGKVNTDDYTQFIDANVGIQGAPFPTAGGIAGGVSSGVGAVPEPSALGILVGGSALVMRRRRRPL